MFLSMLLNAYQVESNSKLSSRCTSEFVLVSIALNLDLGGRRFVLK